MKCSALMSAGSFVHLNSSQCNPWCNIVDFLPHCLLLLLGGGGGGGYREPFTILAQKQTRLGETFRTVSNNTVWREACLTQ